MTHEEPLKTRSVNALKIFSIVYILLILKGIDRLIHAGIWAEDGKIFLKQSFEIGWASLFIPYDGYFHTVPRLITLAATWLPITFIPYFIVLTCYAIFAYAASLVLYRPYAWLFDKRAFAILCCILLLLSPGQIITLGNAANIHWYLLLILLLFGLKDLDHPYTIWELIAAFLCTASEGAALILFPLYVTRVVFKLTIKKRLSAYFGDLLICSFLLLFTVIHLSISDASPGHVDFSSYFKILHDHFFTFFILHPFSGDMLLSLIPRYAVAIQIGAYCVSIALFFLLRRTWKKELVLLLIASACSLLLPVMIAMARPQNLEILKSYFNYDVYEWFRFRYSFFIPAVAAIFWCAVLSRIHSPKWAASFLVTLILVVNIWGNSYRLPIYGYKEFKDWHAKADKLHKSMKYGCPRTVHIRINPGQWSVVFRSPIHSNCDADQAE